MSRSTIWPLVGVSLTASVLVLVGCTRSSNPNSQPAPNPRQPVSAKSASTKLIADWPTPAAAILLTGQMIGYLEPCGCTEGQQGGLGRRYDLVQRLKSQGWPLALLDLGSFAEPPSSRGGPLQAQVKFDIAWQALELLKYDAVGLSPDDLRQGVFETLAKLNNLVDQHPKPAIVAANATPESSFGALVKPSLRVTAGPFKIGVTAAIDPAIYDALQDPTKDMLKVSAPLEALKPILADLEKDTNVQVLMVQGSLEKARELATALPGFDVVLAASEVPDPDSAPQMLNDGKTLLVQVGKKGKYVGVVGLFDDKDPKQKIRYHRVTLNQSYDRSPEPMQKLVEFEFQEQLKQLDVLAQYPKHNFVGGAPDAIYAGADTCKSCHPNTYAKWASTNHAKAYKALYEKGRDRRFDAECVSCHTTGFEYTSGYTSEVATPYLKGNQCENCHGPGSAHTADPTNTEFSKLLTQAVANPEKGLCYRCHDEDNSPHFDFQTYYGKIIHKGLDKYDDPKVRQGLKATPAAAPSR